MRRKDVDDEQVTTKQKKPFYKRTWFLVIVGLIVLSAIFGGGDKESAQPVAESTEPTTQSTQLVAESSETESVSGNLSDEEFQKVDDDVSNWTIQQGEVSFKEVDDYIKTKNLTDDDYNKMVAIMKDGIDFDSQAFHAYSSLLEEGKTEEEAKTELTARGFTEENLSYALANYTPPVSQEYQNALKKAESYSSSMHMSKQGIYDQLTSEYGEGFPADAAQYAIDTIQVDWNENAYLKGKSYFEDLAMSLDAVYDQLVSEYGEKYTAEEAQYAVDKLKNEQ